MAIRYVAAVFGHQLFYGCVRGLNRIAPAVLATAVAIEGYRPVAIRAIPRVARRTWIPAVRGLVEQEPLHAGHDAAFNPPAPMFARMSASVRLLTC